MAETPNPNINLIRSLIFVGVVLLFWVLKFHNWSAHNKSLSANPAWAVGYFNGIVGGGPKRPPYARYIFQVNGVTYEAHTEPDRLTYLGSKVWTTCFPILYSTRDTSINEVIFDQQDLYKLGIQVPNPIEDSVKDAEHPLQLAARPYPYTTGMRQGYYLHYDFNDSHEYLTLRGPQGDTIKKVLVGAERGTPFNNFGYIIADFDDDFVLAHNHDSTQPPHIQLFQKQTGATLLDPGAVWIGADERRQELVYRIDGDEQNIFVCSANHSVRKLFTGFAIAAFNAWNPMVRRAIVIANAPAKTKVHQPILIR